MAIPIVKHQKHSGILVPVFALRGSNDLGIGDTQSVREMIDWCARHKFTVLQLLPINETGEDNSPYNAISSRALDPTTLQISPSSIPDLSKTAFNRLTPTHLLKDLQQGPVQYRKVKALKSSLLKVAFQGFLDQHHAKDSSRAQEFRTFILENSDWISDYALFRTLMEKNEGHSVWSRWPQEHHSPVYARSWILSRPEAEQADLEHLQLFQCYVQWIAHQQWTQLKAYASKQNVLMMGDIPFGIGRYSADVWAFPQQFNLRWSCGAPPESFFKPDLFTERWGQNWGIPLYHWDRMKEDGYAWWKSRIKGTSQMFHYFRIDHVLGFYRVYAYPWIPEQNHLYTDLSQDQARAKAGDLPRFWPGSDQDPHQRWLNEQHGEGLLKMLIEAGGSTGIIAEDLGMVPEYVRPSLTRLGIPGFKIPLFERNQDGSYKDSNDYPELSITTPATHDHNPLAALWNDWIQSPEPKSELQHFLKWIDWGTRPIPQHYSLEVHEAVCKKMLASPSQFVIFMVTDLLGQTQRFNVPGPMSDSNWTERLPMTMEQLDNDPQWTPWIKAAEKFLPRNEALIPK